LHALHGKLAGEENPSAIPHTKYACDSSGCLHGAKDGQNMLGAGASTSWGIEMTVNGLFQSKADT